MLFEKVLFEQLFIFEGVQPFGRAQGKHYKFKLLPVLINLFGIDNGKMVGEDALEIFVQVERIGKTHVLYA